MPVQYAWRHDGGHVSNFILHALAVIMGSHVAIMGSHMAVMGSHEPAIMGLESRGLSARVTKQLLLILVKCNYDFKHISCLCICPENVLHMTSAAYIQNALQKTIAVEVNTINPDQTASKGFYTNLLALSQSSIDEVE